jgi:outer membrane lipoprotein SlyB
MDNLHAAGEEHAQPNTGNPARSASHYEITIRLRDGSKRVIVDANPAVWRVGERVSVIDSKTLARK